MLVLYAVSWYMQNQHLAIFGKNYFADTAAAYQYDVNRQIIFLLLSVLILLFFFD